jgi:hypothetical protein
VVADTREAACIEGATFIAAQGAPVPGHPASGIMTSAVQIAICWSRVTA